MLERGIILVPTLLVMDRIIQQWDQYKDNPNLRSIPRRHRGHRHAFDLALRAGVKMGAGVDPTPGTTAFAEVAEEVALMVEYGLSPMRGVQAATAVAAEALGQQHCLGILAPGKLADVIAVQGNPLDDIGALARVELVVKDGEVIRSPVAPSSW
jgi:imidazolonepropionase-like amidohydrolase